MVSMNNGKLCGRSLLLTTNPDLRLIFSRLLGFFSSFSINTRFVAHALASTQDTLVDLVENLALDVVHQQCFIVALVQKRIVLQTHTDCVKPESHQQVLVVHQGSLMAPVLFSEILDHIWRQDITSTA